ncbi:site-specific integrase [Lysobacter yananisis]|uniref:Site-specific integrase n=1 Tax=Lysobacter yananisis TaxID=1003114 RepID=A0ABY9P9U7_9GAMM|nr:site-specific integrase [Lysobacter yananisis]WMT02936.1 site-specific integrase [Lysobacter yananisis]
MRIPHHLVRSSTGLWSFRQRVPTDLHFVVGRRIIKRTLRTTDLRQAQVNALALADGYAQAFTLLRGLPMGWSDKKGVDALIAGVTAGKTRDLTVERVHKPDGTIKEIWQIDTPEDARLYRSATRNTASATPVVATPAQRAVPARSASSADIVPITLGKAKDAWLASLAGRTLPKTLSTKATAITDLTEFLGANKKVGSITRNDVARWFQHMRDNHIASPTLDSKQSFIGGEDSFFSWAMATGHYPQDQNPCTEHNNYSSREKRERRKKYSFKAYDTEQLQALFAPEALEKQKLPFRWACLIGLYTGARVSEVGQLRVADILVKDGIPCINFTDEGEHQHLKTDVSKRVVPIHPHLLDLGFQQWVDTLKSKGNDRLFTNASPTAKNGAGNWITKAFGRHLGMVAQDWDPGKRGFHSLRKTMIQEMQGRAVASELRAQIVGHELSDEHHSTYSRDLRPREKLHGTSAGDVRSAGLSVLNYGLDLNGLRRVLSN